MQGRSLWDDMLDGIQRLKEENEFLINLKNRAVDELIKTEAEAAMMRKELEVAFSILERHEPVWYTVGDHCRLAHALSTNAGKELLERMLSLELENRNLKEMLQNAT